MSYIDALEWTYRRDIDTIKSWDYILLKEAVCCLKNIISPRNERLAGTSALEHLGTAAVTGDAPYVTLLKDHKYNYTIRTGSYPQIIHESSFNATGGTITGTSFQMEKHTPTGYQQ